MSVLITFKPSGVSGLVAEGTYLVDAARRMGVALGTICTGTGECLNCLVSMTTGAGLLSAPSEVEKKVLGPDRLFQAERLACQVIIERTGELVVNVSSARKATVNDSEQSDLRKKFSELPLQKKIAMLMQLEVLTVSEAFDAAIEKPLALGAKVLDAVAERAKTAREQQRQKKRPHEHQAGKKQ